MGRSKTDTLQTISPVFDITPFHENSSGGKGWKK
jgi:hypothetical protein